MSSLLTDCTAGATWGNSRKRAQLDGSSSPQSPSTVRSVHTRQIRPRTIASNSSNVCAIRLPPDVYCTRATMRQLPCADTVIIDYMDISERNAFRKGLPQRDLTQA